MNDIRLDTDEVILVESVANENGTKNHGTLYITNKNIRFAIYSGFFVNKFKEERVKSLYRIKKFNNQAWVRVKSDNKIVFSFDDGDYSFYVENSSIAKKMANEINHIVIGTTEDLYPTESAFEGAEQIGKAVHDSAVALFGTMFGKEPETVTTKCPSCGSSLSGKKGTIVTCDHCGTKVKL